MLDDKIYKYLRYSALISFFFAGVSYALFSATILHLGFIIGSGLYYNYLTKQNIEEINQKKLLTLLIAIVTLPVNFIASIFALMSTDLLADKIKIYVNAPPKKDKKIIDPTVKKMDLLLKLGCIMVLISGLIFSTTSWEVVPNILKLVFCILLGIGFIGLSKFSENKLKINSTTNLYYFLGISFFILGYYSIGYLEIISNEFSLFGSLSDLYLGTLYLVIMLCLYFFYEKFKNDIYKHLMFLSGIMTLISFLNQFKVNEMYYFLTINIFILFINFIINNKSLKIVALFCIFISFMNLDLFNNNLILLSNYLVTTTSLLVISNRSSRLTKGWVPILINLLLYLTVLSTELEIELMIIITGFITTIGYIILILTNYINNSEEFKKSFIISSNILMLIIYFSATMIDYKLALIIIIMTLLTNSLYFIKDKKEKTELYMQPAKIFIFVISIFNIFEQVNDNWMILAIATLSLVLYKFIKEVNLKNIYLLIGITSLIISIFMFSNQATIIASLTSVSLLYYILEKNKSIKTGFFIIMLALIYKTSNTLFTNYQFIGYLITIMILLGITLFKKNNQLEQKIANIGILIPFYNIVHNINLDFEIDNIIFISYYLFLIYLVDRLFIKNEKQKNTFVTVAMSFLTLCYINTGSYLVGIFIGVILLGAIIISLTNEEYKGLFYYAIIFTILNIIILLQDVWKIIPFWAYLLLTGLIIIGLGTYKLSKDIDKK